ncbi:MAG: hypothetical protein IJP61_11400 [Treponema sp.]|nr:hypothetical protein [Treponema sp.]
MRNIFFALALTLFSFSAFPNELIIYRPENSQTINEVRCWIQLVDENGNDVTYTKARAAYAWMDRPNELHWYEKSFYVSGGMACHLYLDSKNGEKYKIRVYTPKNHVQDFPIPEKLQTDWRSNEFEYDCAKVKNSAEGKYNPLKVIFVSPVANDNGFYEPEWHIDYKAPKFWRMTKPVRK